MFDQFDLSQLSSGVAYLNQGYLEYIEAVISGRALPDGYDGLKPVNRRILYMMKKDKVYKFRKSARVTGDTMGLFHPHGTSSIYQAMVPMTQSNGSYAYPLLIGSGSFGGVYKDDQPAAERYTEVKLHSNADEYFNEMNGIDMVPNFDATEMEPVVLPVPFPAVLINATSGIAVGFSSNIPSFNFNDVCDLVTEFIKDGECHTVIEPDFVTGGYYVRNAKELQKLMRVGVAKLKLRAKTVVNGKAIECLEVPFGRTIQKLVKQINDLNADSIRNAYDSDDFDHDTGFTIDCTSKKRVDEALYTVFKKTDMQYNFAANITVVYDGVPQTLGVWEVIRRWVEWRRKVLRKEFAKRIENLEQSSREATAFMSIVNSYDKKMELVRIIADQGRDAGKKYIKDNFTREEVPEDLIDFCSSRSIPSYHTGGKYLSIYNSFETQLQELKKSYDNVDDVILKKMQELKSIYGTKLKRRTEVTTKDFEFIEEDTPKEKAIDSSYCTYEVRDGFIRKLRYASGDEDVQWRIDGKASDTLIMFDNRGRLLRVYGQDLAYYGVSELGIYLPTYLGLNETDDYRITYVGLLDGRELMLLYRDGNVGFVNTADWVGNNRNVRVLQKGISVSSASELGAVIPFEEAGEMLFVMDMNGRMSWAYTKDIKHKDRTAKTRVFDLASKTPLHSYVFKDTIAGSTFLNNVGAYCGKLRYLEAAEDYRGEEGELIELMQY